MIRRLFSVSIVLGLLLLGLLVASSQRAFALTATLVPSKTPTPVGNIGYRTIAGKVTDASTGLPIAGATVTCSHTSYVSGTRCTGTRITAADGTYSYTNVYIHDTDGIKVSVQATGYTSQSVTKSGVYFLGGASVNIALVPATTITATPTSTLPDLKIVSMTSTYAGAACMNNPYIAVVVSNIGAGNATAFSVSLNTTVQSVVGLAAGQQITLSFPLNSVAATNLATADSTSVIAESNETNNTLSGLLPVPSAGPTCTPTSVISPTPTRTPTATPSVIGTCSPVTSTITAPFTFDGAGTFCWQAATLGGYINSWNTTAVSINGVNISNQYVPSASYPAKVGGYWYISYNSSVAWAHLETK